ncbi:MAG TPA: D-alanyl-D-alanine carboxypeptidase family protein [Treponemataceae bacterium]|nr:D-alanyl-D-alanine carboxypeptidase family protein [Treponemataceae bacterium]
MTTDTKTHSRTTTIIKKLFIIVVIFMLGFVTVLGTRIFILSNPKANSLSVLDTARLENICSLKFARNSMRPLFWDAPTKNIEVAAESAIMINLANGDILFEKNADEVIPPASMTKLVVMYVVFEEIAAGKISMNDIVPLPPESWAQNAPPNSSIMFLEDGQTVSLRELLLGLAVCSGNDAAIAVAHYVSGSVEAFVERMNLEMKKLGLEKTNFVEPSGYDEHNLTTAREFTRFARFYVQKYPQALVDFHSVKKITYPKQENLASWHKNDGIDRSITQFNTNKALNAIEGVNGLKTGFIYESGYNLSTTAQRNNLQLLTVTLKGKGSNSSEGNRWRIHDASQMLETAFSSLQTSNVSSVEATPIAIAGGKESAFLLHQAWTTPVTIPYDANTDTQPALSRTISIQPQIKAPIQAGDRIGTVSYTCDSHTIAEIPLVADRTIEKAFFLIRCIDNIAIQFIK